MRHKGTEQIKNNNKLGISDGLVDRRRAELIAAKLVMNTAPIQVPESSKISIDQVIKPEESGRVLNHMTRSRPVFTHRPPSRRSPQLFDTKNHRDEEISEKKSESVSDPQEIDLIALIRKSVHDAQTLYRNHYFLGTDSRQARGFFTWWRHGIGGQLKADEFYLEIQNIDTIELLLVEITSFFFNPMTHYNNHSFSSYLLDEFNKLMSHLSLPGCPLGTGESYSYHSWLVIAAQLKQLIPADEKLCDSAEHLFGGGDFFIMSS